MAKIDKQQDESMPVVSDLDSFNVRSGNIIEQLIFNGRMVIVFFCVALSLFLGYQASKLEMNANFEKLLPQSHDYISNYLTYQAELSGLGNTLQVVVEHTEGDIFDAEYLDTLSKIHDDLFLSPGTDRSFIKSLWAPLVRWQEVTEQGFDGGPVMPPTFDGSPEAIAELRENVSRAGLIGTLVANDLRSSMIVVPLVDFNPETGKPLNYRDYSMALEEIRNKYESASEGKIKVRMIGYVQLVGDLISGLGQVILFFAIALILALIILYIYTRDIRSTLLLVVCSLVGVVWQLGLIRLLGFNLDPYSILVPFLVFAIGVSHGAQKMNGIMQDIGRGTHKYVAARYTFRRLFVAGITALAADVAGFAVLLLIDIPVIQELALAASIGVGMLVFTNLVLLPVLLSYFGVSAAAAIRSVKSEEAYGPPKTTEKLWRFLENFTQRRWASGAIVVAILLGGVGAIVAQDIQVGDLHDGAPELRSDSRYNLDSDFINLNFGQSSDVFATIVVTPPNGCENYETLIKADRLGWILSQDPAVQSTQSLATHVSRITMGQFENNPKWNTISTNPGLTNSALVRIENSNPDLMNATCSVFPIVAYLSDHKADTLSRILATVEDFADENDTDEIKFLPAAGSAGIGAVTNLVVYDWNRKILILVYVAVALLSFITFRSWRAVLVALLPLVLTSILCEALMVMLDIGLKVATLPVVALGVGIGIDYALYLLSMQLAFQRTGMPLKHAYRKAVQFTGKVVALIGITLSAGVVTWAFSPIKFQADMGILLAFMFLLNMVGALILIPALSHFLLPDHKFVSGPGSAVVPDAKPKLRHAVRLRQEATVQ